MINVLLYSGGLDSYIASYYLYVQKRIDKLLPVYVDLKTQYSKQEIRHIKNQTIANYSVVILKDYLNLRDLEEEISGYVPNRNLMLFSIVSSYINFTSRDQEITLYTGGLKDDLVNDQNPDFYQSTSTTLSLSLNTRIEIKSAFDFSMTKQEIVNWFNDTLPNKAKTLDKDTFSCYSPILHKECLGCKACFRKNVAIQDIVLRDFYNNEILAEYKVSALNGKYDESRCKNILRYLERIGR
jgi:7-cyano-7-deazaguanine synthase in queuosine biosynthesis